MIDTKQLRKGNLIYGVSDRIEEVVEIKKNTLVTKHFHPDFDDSFECENEYFSFIPLSRRLALQLGFQDLGEGVYNLDEWITLDFEDSDEEPVSYDVFCRGHYLTCVSYVHQIQNLVYDLGEELTYNQKI